MSFARGKGRGSKYGADHQTERRARVGVTVFPGDPCGYCLQPLPANTSTWHLPHNPSGTAYLPGMWHAACNIREAAQRGARIVNGRRNRGMVKKPAKGRRLTW